MLTSNGGGSLTNPPALLDELIYSIQRNVYLCNDRRYGLIKNITYRKDGVVDSEVEYRNEQINYELVVPETMAETILQTVCRPTPASK